MTNDEVRKRHSSFGVGLVAGGAGGGPAGEGEAVDFGVVADIDREGGPEVEELDAGGVGMTFGDFAEFAGEAAALGAVGDEGGGRGFDDDGEALAAERAEADQGAAADVGVGVEEGFDLFGEEWAVAGVHALGFASAEPESAGVVEVAGVAETVVNDGLAVGMRVG